MDLSKLSNSPAMTLMTHLPPLFKTFQYMTTENSLISHGRSHRSNEWFSLPLNYSLLWFGSLKKFRKTNISLETFKKGLLFSLTGKYTKFKKSCSTRLISFFDQNGWKNHLKIVFYPQALGWGRTLEVLCTSVCSDLFWKNCFGYL